MGFSKIPSWLLAIALLLFSIGFLLSLFFLEEPRYFAGLPFGPKGSGWPEGSYGILANGDCPDGFVRHEGKLLAIKLFANDVRYISPSTFGNSNLGIHNLGRSGNLGDLNLVTCIK